MVNSLRSKFVRTLSPALCVGMLLGAAQLQQIAWPAAADSKPFHARAVAAINAIPLEIERWSGIEVAPPPAAIDVLRPNVIRTIEYVDQSLPVRADGRRSDTRIWLSIVECGRASEMLGHFPPKCYPAYGDTLIQTTARRWSIPSEASAEPLVIDGMAYAFERTVSGQTFRRSVYNFMVAPQRGIVPDMKGLGEAAEDYRRRYLGAAQVQVVFVSPVGQEPTDAERDKVFSTLMRASGPAIEVLKSGE